MVDDYDENPAGRYVYICSGSDVCAYTDTGTCGSTDSDTCSDRYVSAYSNADHYPDTDDNTDTDT